MRPSVWGSQTPEHAHNPLKQVMHADPCLYIYLISVRVAVREGGVEGGGGGDGDDVGRGGDQGLVMWSNTEASASPGGPCLRAGRGPRGVSGPGKGHSQLGTD